ncbi:Peroxiredoxin [Dyadobacter sp. SG02]|uniref:TlpA family protein disulfide reductase n=1 Tax=Dyadobacter sp. SG02 TaxID=1855291 RepID=UPI0008CF909A|nr:TlpA disulfide reductase family protein [Dyadobacter sp. SG02]SEJ52803.1 Peroxiredoxin [Dyadobacter sp. SG02]
MKKIILATLLTGLHIQLLAMKMDITVTYERASMGDTLFLQYYDTFFPRVIKPSMVSAVRSGDGTYHFCVDLHSPVRFSILKRLDVNDYPNLKGSHFKFNTILSNYYWQGDESLLIHIRKRTTSAPQMNQANFDFSYQFIGKESVRHRAKALSDSAFYWTELTIDDRQNLAEPDVRRINAGLEVLDSFRESLSQAEYQLLKAEIIFRHPVEKLAEIKQQIGQMNREQRYATLAKLDKFFDRGIDEKVLTQSQSYVHYWFERQMLGMIAKNGRTNSDSLLTLRLNQRSSLLSDRLTTYLLVYGQAQNMGKIIPSILTSVADTDCQQVINSVSGRGVGNKMLNFELPDTNGKLVNLSSFKGRAVLIDFWYTGCGGCVNFYNKVLSKVEQEMQGQNIAFVAISIDAGKESWIKSVKGGRYTSDLATNLYTGGAGSKHELLSHYGIDSFPTLIVIDPEGNIANFNSKELRDPVTLKQKLIELSTR